MTKKKQDPFEKQEEGSERTLSRSKQDLPVKLQAEEMGVMGLRLANVLQQHGEFLLQAKKVKDGLKLQEEGINSDMERIAAAIRSGVEVRPVEVEIRADFGTGMVAVVRIDTGETLTTRKLTDDERQKKMVFDVEKADAAADEAIEKGEVPKVELPPAEPTPGEINEYFNRENDGPDA